MIYLACYLGSCLFAYLNFKTKKENRIVSSVFMAVAILIPCFIAGIRDFHIRTDVNVYVKPVIESMRNSSTGLFTLLYNEIFVEETNGLFFTAMLYIFSRFENGLFLALFTIEFLCLFPVYCTILKQKLSAGLKAISLFCYFCFFYHLSLNLMKQCIAVSIVFWGFDLLKKGKDKKFLFLILLTTLLVHKTAIIALLIYAVYILSVNKNEALINRYIKVKVSMEEKSERRKKNWCFFILIAASIFMIFNVRFILEILVHIKHSYIYQLSHMKSFELKYSNFLVMILLLLPINILRRNKLKTDYEYRFYNFTLIFSTVLYQFVGVSPALYRLSLYLLIFVVLAVPDFIKLFRKDERILMSAYYMLIPAVNFVFEVIMNSYAEVYPYATMLG